MDNCFMNRENYGVYTTLIDTYNISIDCKTINSIDAWRHHFATLLNVFNDGIESDIIKRGRVRVIFTDGVEVRLSVPDYYFNLIMWYLKKILKKQKKFH